MSTAPSSYVQAPPQSTGKKIATTARAVLSYDNKTGTFSIDDIVVGGTDGSTGRITGIETAGFAANAGLLYLEAVLFG